jgi:hypothetical protein
LSKELKEFYFSKMVTNKLPQTYLYSAYERPWRYMKILNMFEKLLIVVVTMFFQEWAYSNFKVRCCYAAATNTPLMPTPSRPARSWSAPT